MLQRTGKPAGASDTGHLDASEIADLFHGHEVAIHTVNHPYLPRTDRCRIAYEVLEDRRELEALVGYPVRGMAYPFGTHDERSIEILRALGITYCRATFNASCCFPPAEPLAWGTTAHQFAVSPSVPEMFERLHSNPKYSGVFFPWGHSCEFHYLNDWAALDRIFKPLSGKDDVWYCTNIQLFDYEDARRRMVVAANQASAYNPSGVAVTLLVDGKSAEVLPGQTVSFPPPQ